MSPGRKKLSVSLVITVKDDAAGLAGTLAALQKQTLFPDEIILTVARSGDETLEFSENWAKKHSNVRVIEQEKLSRSEGRNLGVQEAQHEIILFTDAGCFPHPDWVREITQPFLDENIKLVSGYTKVQDSSAFTEAQGAFVLVPLEKISEHPLPATRNMAIRRSVFLENKGFLPHLNFAEDYEFSRRLALNDVQAVFVPSAVVEWAARPDLPSFFHMTQQLTRGDVQASTWRRGHLTMWLRYLFFLLAFFCVSSIFSWQTALFAVTILYSSYLLFKLTRFRFARMQSYFWAILFQVVADFAVLSGTLRGIFSR